MRFGALAALQRQHVDIAAGLVEVRVAQIELGTGQLVIGPPKTAAGRRVIAIPATLLPDVRRHLAEYVSPEPDALVFAGPNGAPLRRSNFSKPWAQAFAGAGMEKGVHFHDRRHTGNTLAAQAGANLSDLMARMGHASSRAALIHLHTNSQRDRVVADALNNLLTARSGTTAHRAGQAGGQG